MPKITKTQLKALTELKISKSSSSDKINSSEIREVIYSLVDSLSHEDDKLPVSKIDTTGTASDITFLRGDGVWSEVQGSGQGFTQEQVEDIVNDLISDGTGIVKSYDDNNGILNISVDPSILTKLNNITVTSPIDLDDIKSDVQINNDKITYPSSDSDKVANLPADQSAVNSTLQFNIDGKEPLKGVDDNYVTDAEKTVIGNTSGTNTGNQDISLSGNDLSITEGSTVTLPTVSDGLGWTGGSYNGTTGVVTFARDDGLGFVTGDIRGEDGAQGPPGPGGSATQWRSGAGAPSDALGDDNDFYLNESNGDVYQKSAGTYSVVTNIQGADGATVATGAQGEQGIAGADGLGFTGGSYNGSTGIVTITSDDGLGFTTGDLRGADGSNGADGNGIKTTVDNLDGTFTITFDDDTTFTTSDFTGPQGATGAAGADGQDGADGKTILNGTSTPSGGTGVDGDFYINTATNDIYGPKTAGSWGSGTSLVGPQGTAGADGIDATATTDASELTTGELPDARLSTNVTTEGNLFNGNLQLVKTDSSGVISADLIDPADFEVFDPSSYASTTGVDFNPALDFSESKYANDYVVPTGEDLTLSKAPVTNIAGNEISVKITVDGSQDIIFPPGTIIHPSDAFQTTQPAGDYYAYFSYDGTNIIAWFPSFREIPQPASQLVFREPFYAVGADNASPGTLNWYSHSNSNAVVDTGRLRDYTGKGSDVPVNAGYTEESVLGIVYQNSGGFSRDRSMLWTDKYTISRTGQELTRATFYYGHADTATKSYFAIRIGSQWYAYKDHITSNSSISSGSGFASSALIFDEAFDMASGGQWLSLDFVPTTSLNLGTAIAGTLPAGDITAFGIFSDHISNITTDVRFDTIEIYTTVP